MLKRASATNLLKWISLQQTQLSGGYSICQRVHHGLAANGQRKERLGVVNEALLVGTLGLDRCFQLSAVHVTWLILHLSVSLSLRLPPFPSFPPPLHPDSQVQAQPSFCPLHFWLWLQKTVALLSPGRPCTSHFHTFPWMVPLPCKPHAA